MICYKSFYEMTKYFVLFDIYLFELIILCSIRIYIYIYMYILFLIFLEFRNTLKRYAEIGQYRNISFHWIN